MTTKAEGIAETSTNLALLGLVECEVQIVVNLWIIVALLVVDCGRNDVVLNSQDSDHSLYCASGTQQVTSHRLRRRDVQLEGCIAEDFLDGLSLRDVTNVGRGTVYVDVVDILRLHIGILQCVLHHEFSAQTLRMRSSDVVSISAHTSTYHLSIDLSTTSLSVLQLLENQATRTLGHDESVAASAERTAGLLGLVVTC